MINDTTTHVRYMVSDVGEAVDFYTKHFGFEGPVGPSSPAFASVIRGNLRLLLSGPQSSAGRAMHDGAQPGPGGRQILVEDPSGNLIELFQPSVG